MLYQPLFSFLVYRLVRCLVFHLPIFLKVFYFICPFDITFVILPALTDITVLDLLECLDLRSSSTVLWT